MFIEPQAPLINTKRGHTERMAGIHVREKVLIQKVEGIRRGCGGGGFQVDRISTGRRHMGEKSRTRGNSMGICTEVEQKRPHLEKGHCPLWLEEKGQKAKQGGHRLGGRGEHQRRGPYLGGNGETVEVLEQVSGSPEV